MAAQEKAATQLFRYWLISANVTGCRFASSLARVRSRLNITEYQVSPEKLNAAAIGAIVDASEPRLPNILLFPTCRSARDVADLIGVLGGAARWTVDVRNPKRANQEWFDVRMSWQTQNGLPSTAMGFAPLPQMPATRRAPLVALALWSGGHDNPFHRIKNTRPVTLADCPTELDEAEYRDAWGQSEDLTRSNLLGQFDAKALRRVTFCLPTSIREHLNAKLNP